MWLPKGLGSTPRDPPSRAQARHPKTWKPAWLTKTQEPVHGACRRSMTHGATIIKQKDDETAHRVGGALGTTTPTLYNCMRGMTESPEGSRSMHPSSNKRMVRPPNRWGVPLGPKHQGRRRRREQIQSPRAGARRVAEVELRWRGPVTTAACQHRSVTWPSTPTPRKSALAATKRCEMASAMQCCASAPRSSAASLGARSRRPSGGS